MKRKAIKKGNEFRDEKLDQFGGWLYFPTEEDKKKSKKVKDEFHKF